MDPDFTLALDIGSTRLKGACITADGTVAAVASDASPLADRDCSADEVLRAVVTLAVGVAEGRRPRALALTGATRTELQVAADGTPLGALMRLDDSGGAAHAAAVRAAYGAADDPVPWTFHPVSRLLYASGARGDAATAATWWMELKDWLNLQCTGHAVTDPTTDARSRPAAPLTREDALRRLGLLAPAFPPVVAAGTVIGGLRAVSARTPRPDWPTAWRGIPVVQCGFDAWCTTLGLGLAAAGDAYDIGGTTEVLGVLDAQPRTLPGALTLPWLEGVFHVGGPCSTGLGTLAAYGRDLLDDADPAALLACAATLDVHAAADGPLCLPFRDGERMPFWDPALRGRFIDVQAGHGRAHLARAVVDGLMLFHAAVLDWLGPRADGAVLLAGGGCMLPGWAQAKAAALGRPVQVADQAEAALLGAARCGWTALGAHATLAQAAVAHTPARRTVVPAPAGVARLAAVRQRLAPHWPAPLTAAATRTTPQPG